jgi:hypothetical protein
MKAPQQTKCYKEVRNVSETNVIDLCSSIQNETWIEVSRENDIEKKWDSFYSIFNYHFFNIACPKVRRNIVKYFKKSLDKQRCHYSKGKTIGSVQPLYAKQDSRT